MRRRPAFWIVLGVLLLIGLSVGLRVRSHRVPTLSSISHPQSSSSRVRGPVASNAIAGGPAVSNTAHLPSPDSMARAERLLAERAKRVPKFKNRLSNTTASVGELTRKDHAILLGNALFDTEKPVTPSIPNHLRSPDDPGSYIVQSKTPIDKAFRDALAQAGAAIVPNFYIPNNALVVRADADVAQQLAGLPQTQAVLPFEPYYKLQAGLLDEAINQRELPEGSVLNVLLFADKKDATIAELNKLGAQVVANERNYFGQVVRIVPPANWTEVARLSGVQLVEVSHSRVRANDLSRVRIGVATDSTNDLTYLGLTGSNVMVNVNDTGVDTNHPDLIGRVFGDFGSSLVDSNGHGTHVAGIIASSGNNSFTVTNASGSLNPGTNHQYRGIAPLANIFAMSVDAGFGPVSRETSFGPSVSDTYLQEGAAKTNALISNNSWHYFGDYDYDLAAASYDAAVRDSLPGVTGSQGLSYVFAAGNSGGGDDTGQNGGGDTILSPATAKNVITVGAIEQYRLITNRVRVPTGALDTNNQPIFSTNTPWIGLTDSSNQVASFSSRGNVGIGTEGNFGRFKPDVVAPGTFVVSTTKKDDWDQISYYNPTNYELVFFFGTVATNALDLYSIFIPFNAVWFTIDVEPNALPIYVSSAGFPTTNSTSRIGRFQIGPANDPNADLPLSATDADWFFGIGNPSNAPIDYSVQVTIATTNNPGDYFEVLSNLNNNCGPYYRYESGTSMSAAEVSGSLALMQQYFQQLPQPITNSPALMKALLINGARSLSGAYNFLVTNVLDLQGWGLINVPATLQTNVNIGGKLVNTGTSMLAFDQNPTNALATGQSSTYHIQLSDEAQNNPLRVTLAWTDPPGNPVVGAKLVNNLDLIVTNLDDPTNPIIYAGNDIPDSSVFNVPWDTNSTPNFDTVNNVENVYLFPGSGTNFYVTVLAKSVNVNAVTAQTNEVEQDYALVISSGDGDVTNAIQLVQTPNTITNLAPQVTVLSNQFDNLQPQGGGAPIIGGGSVDHQRVGASFQIPGTNVLALANLDGNPINGQITLGTTNGWHFYVVTNTHGFTNAAFLIDVPIPTSISPVVSNFTRVEADLDLYVSTDPAITNLDPVAIAASDKSLERGGSETVVLSNAVQGLYYVGVKSEDQEAADYSFAALFSQNPFSDEDPNGQRVHGINVPAIIPDGTPQRPGVADIFAVAVARMTTKRVIVTNVLTHELTGDLFGTLRHTLLESVVNNHSGSSGVTNQMYIYDDSGRRDIVGSQRTDFPGNLTVFNATPGQGQWHFVMQDNAPTHTGTNLDFQMYIERQRDPLQGLLITLPPGGCDNEYLYVAPEDTNLTVIAAITAGAGPVSVQVCPLGASGTDCAQMSLPGLTPTNSITIDKSSDPPLNAGTYVITICNNGSSDVTVFLQAFLIPDVKGVIPTQFASAGETAIKDDAVTYSTINVASSSTSDPMKIVRAEVGVRIDHPRISDLVLRLISPDGTRMLLDQNRGGLSSGMGTNNFSTNIVPVNSNGDWHAQTNIIDLGFVPATFQVSWDFFRVPDFMHIYYGGKLVFDSGLVSGQGTFTTNFPGPPTQVTIVMNEGGNTEHKSTAWRYTVTSSSANYAYTWFTEDTNKTITPIKFAIPPFVPTNTSGSNAFSTFETATAGDYPIGNNVDGWAVTANQVSVFADPTNANSGSHALALANGSLARTLTTVPGQTYTLTYNYRGPGIVGWWRAENNNFSDSVAGRNGTPQNNVTFTTGEVGEAFQFTPSQCRIYMTDDPAFMLTNSLSAEAWVKPTGFGYTIFWRGDDRAGFDPYVLSMDGSGNVSFGVSDATPPNGTTATTAGIPIPLNQWSHVAGTLDGTSGALSIYTNGVLANQITTAIRPFGPLIASDKPNVCIGNVDVNNDFPFIGDIDEVSLYGRALSASEVKAIYMAGSAGKFDPTTNSLVAGLAKMQISMGGITNVVYGGNTNWSTGLITFTATSSSTTLLLDGLEPGMLVDDFVLSSSGIPPIYLLPEDPYGLSTLQGKSAIGDWQLEIWDNRVGPPVTDTNNGPKLLSWALSFVTATARPVPIPLVHDQDGTNNLTAGHWQYYTITVPSWASFATNILISATPAVNVWFNQNGPPTGTNVGDFNLLAVQNSGSVTLVTNTTPPPLPPLVRGSTYYIGIENTNTTTASISFKVDFDVTPLTNAIPVTSPADPALPRFFSYNVTNGEGGIAVLLTNMNGNADLVVRKTPFPDLSTFDYGSFNTSSNDEDVLIYTNSDPVILGPGNWYFGVFDRDPTNVNYSIVVIDVPYIVTLFNATPYANTNNPLLGTNDYYLFTVPSNSVRAQFELDNPSGDVTLVVRKGWPVADMSNYNYISTNAGTSDELITVFNYSSPVRLTPGDWFITAINVSGAPVTYTAMATAWPLYGTNIVITNVFRSSSNSFCITWTSLPGVHYWIGGKKTIFDPTWTNVSPTITAVDYTTTWCLPLPSQYQFFDVFEGLAPGPAASAAAILAGPTAQIVASPNAFTLTWSGPANSQYTVQWTTSLQNPNWQTFPGTITSSNGTYTFTDNGSQTAGLSSSRFYRLVKQ